MFPAALAAPCKRGRLLAEPQRHGDGERRQHLRRLDLTVDKPIPKRRPARRADKREIDTLGFREAVFACHDQRRSVGELQKGDQNRRHTPPPSRSLAVINADATSTIFLFWFIAAFLSAA
jgi:hypothetical protein